MTTLKPCPWCQRTDFLDVLSSVICLQCKARGPVGSNEQDIVTKWNSYVSKLEDPQEIKDIVSRIKQIQSGVPVTNVYPTYSKITYATDCQLVAQWYINQ
jgi:hypothetical protein